jgi:hypothetical protein
MQVFHQMGALTLLFDFAAGEGVKDVPDETPVQKTTMDSVLGAHFEDVQEHVGLLRRLFLFEPPPLQLGRFRLAHDREAMQYASHGVPLCKS